MKKLNLINLLLCTCVLCFISCNGDDSNNNDPTPSADQVSEIAREGTWRISNFNDSGQDETSDFTGYNFNFNADGSVVATNGSETVTGTWSVTESSNSNDDDAGTEDDDFNIFFSVPDTNKFEDLNDDWDIINVTNVKIELVDVSGGNGGTDMLTFEKL